MMKAGYPLFLTVVAILGASWAPAQADLYDFTIQGTYNETLQNPAGTVTLFTDGDAFTIQGTYDTAVQPVVEAVRSADPDAGSYVTHNVTLDDMFLSFLPFFSQGIDHSSITELTFTGMSLDLINQHYPSDGSVRNVGDRKNGSYTTESLMEMPPQSIQTFAVDVYADFTALHVARTTSIALVDPHDPSSDLQTETGYDGYIYYGYYRKDFGSYKKTVHGTLDLNIDSIKIAEHVVPLPSSVVLLASAMATVAGFRKKLRSKESA